jgi:hypothetical protein
LLNSFWLTKNKRTGKDKTDMLYLNKGWAPFLRIVLMKSLDKVYCCFLLKNKTLVILSLGPDFNTYIYIESAELEIICHKSKKKCKDSKYCAPIQKIN